MTFEEQVVHLHSEGFKNREIARTLNVGHYKVGYLLNKLGLKTNGPIKIRPDFVSETEVKCSKCLEIKHFTEYQINRQNQKYEYRISYCNVCRKKQQNENLRSDILKFLGNRFNRLKRRCAISKIPIDIDKNYLFALWFKQEGKCFYTDIEMIWKTPTGLQPSCISIDKIIPEKGYVTGNIVLCQQRINAIKLNMTLEEMKIWTPNWYERIKNYVETNRFP